MSDREKEKALQQQARELFGLLGLLFGGSVLAIGGPLVMVWGVGKMGVGSFAGTLDTLERLDFLAGVTIAGGLGYILYRLKPINRRDRYGTFDRFLHRVAFRLKTAQRALTDVEEVFYGNVVEDISADKPVFITALPRSGTTILLRLLWQTERFASHTYQDMPFVLSPLLWSRYANLLGGKVEATERAHADGLEVSGQSPEAFEEMVWKRFWPSHYQEGRIQPWSPGNEKWEFEAFFEKHMRKVIAARRGYKADDQAENLRYLSKNNLNIARLAAPPEPLRRGTVLVPFRDPVQQSASMLRQHERFLKIHEEDDFVREYMEAIGHHEFGKSLKPVDFNGWLNSAPDPSELAFWMRYWIEAYRFALEHAHEETTFISYARLTEESKAALSALADQVGVSESNLVSQAEALRSPRAHDVDRSQVATPLMQEARKTYVRLDERAAV